MKSREPELGLDILTDVTQFIPRQQASTDWTLPTQEFDVLSYQPPEIILEEQRIYNSVIVYRRPSYDGKHRRSKKAKVLWICLHAGLVIIGMALILASVAILIHQWTSELF